MAVKFITEVGRTFLSNEVVEHIKLVHIPARKAPKYTNQFSLFFILSCLNQVKRNSAMLLSL